jgi:low temperature requirement protein LtrA
MRGRDTGEKHRASTSLELFFDLCFVVAVSQASTQLSERVVEGHAGTAVIGYVAVFFAVWWAWLNFTWFASAYDTDDVLYRVTVLVQMAGVLVLAAGVPKMFDGDFTIAVIGYVIMRIAQTGQWLRVVREHLEGRAAALRYAGGTVAVQVCWVARLALHGTVGRVAWVVLVICEMLVPVWAEYARRTPWHPTHIAERYGLFTLIVLGESVLGATTAVQAGFDAGGEFAGVLKVAIGGLLTCFAMWWLYFDQPAEDLLAEASRTGDYRPSFVWGYGHCLIFGSAAAVGAGLETSVQSALHKAHIAGWAAGLAVAVPVAIYLVTLWLIHARRRSLGYPVAALLILAVPVTGQAVLLIGLIMAALVAYTVATPVRG